jgi:hypothetical protein
MKALVKKILRDYIYRLETLDDIKNISTEAENHFRNELKNHDENALEALRDDDPKPKKDEENKKISFDDKDFKKLFRKLAVKCHPDKLGSDLSERESKFLKQCYEQINIANDTYDWGLLLKVAIDLDIEVDDLSDEHIDNIKSGVAELDEQINKYEQSMAYQWYLKPEGEAKENYLAKCAQIFNASLKSKK